MMRYRASRTDCDVCPLKPRCTPKEPGRKILRSIHEGARDLARCIARTDAFVIAGVRQGSAASQRESSAITSVAIWPRSCPSATSAAGTGSVSCAERHWRLGNMVGSVAMATASSRLHGTRLHGKTYPR